MNNKKSKYTPEELKKALDLIEEGYSFSEASTETNLNKSILAREMRKRKNEKARQHINGNME
jgi:hypothetical protein